MTIQEKLNQLASSTSLYRDWLLQRDPDGIAGSAVNPHNCPVANYIRAEMQALPGVAQVLSVSVCQPHAFVLVSVPFLWGLRSNRVYGADLSDDMLTLIHYIDMQALIGHMPLLTNSDVLKRIGEMR